MEKEAMEQERERQFLLQILRPQRVRLSGRMDGSCVCACSCLPLSHRGASPLFPHWVPEVRGCSLARSPSLSTLLPSTGRGVWKQAPSRAGPTYTNQKHSQATGCWAEPPWGESAQLTCICTRPPFVVQWGDSRLSCKHCASKQTLCLVHRD